MTRCRFREIYLETESDTFDLHNCFDFISVTYDPAAQVARLRWEPNQYAASEQRRSLVVELRGVTHFSATPRDAALPFSEDTCLSAVGGVGPSDPTLDGVYSEVPPGWHHVFTFMSGFVLRIGAESVCVCYPMTSNQSLQPTAGRSDEYSQMTSTLNSATKLGAANGG